MRNKISYGKIYNVFSLTKNCQILDIIYHLKTVLKASDLNLVINKQIKQINVLILTKNSQKFRHHCDYYQYDIFIIS